MMQCGRMPDGTFSTSINSTFENLIKIDESKIVYGLGDGGEAVTLKGREFLEGEASYKNKAFNLVISNKIPLNRTIKDARHPMCSSLSYSSHLPSASVIVVFCNEAWSVLLRTIVSVISQTPDELLKEIILIDDFSDHDELHDKLDYYIRTRLPSKVKLFRLPKRRGLIKARLAGAQAATADVLVFLDAHCEAGIHWLEPLVQRIKEGKNNVVVPIIDVIDDKTLEYQYNNGSYEFQIGGFNWNGHYTWIDVPSREMDRIHHSYTSPVRSPTMAGGLFAINREYFWEIGSYDKEMDLWGGENLEMSFRVWQCGGNLETVPCSRVGHIFRTFHPYTFPNDKDSHGINTVRLAEVWMDEYKRLFYLNRPDLKVQGNDNMCLDNLQKEEEQDTPLGIYSCHSIIVGTQLFSLSHEGELRREYVCAEILDNNKVMMYKCHGGLNQKWTVTRFGQLKNDDSNLCLDSANLISGDTLRVSQCRRVPSQSWKWDNYLETINLNEQL
ncbi:polypeptide N-acetylgalactosaminyltransferase 1 isoform X2 [Nilaparvata lugens]|uniref:polypeptide N-acetylgalactosaminyltransferase 1 isoform X2 n=1 Tax=Nilaparvata lugens TaxID=108931 RepID=UPI00193C8A2C|nr:polypeptide N-acetylgalactosaminyltransferase 1 isoform X2 [Nilaparvata lugens]